MKLSTLGLGFVVAASSFVGISSLSQSATAATIGAENGSFEFVGAWEFTFLYSFGSFQSSFGIEPTPTLFTELSNATPGSVTPSSTVTYTFTGPEKNFFLSTPANPSKILSSGLGSGFFIATGFNGSPVEDSVDVGAQSFSSFVNALALALALENDGTRLIGVNDSSNVDTDYNDFIVKARPVPVPAIVPGIALAAAFFGSKTLKRNKKESKTVA